MDTYDFLADPRTLTMPERLAARDQYDSDQAMWLQRLSALIAAPKPDQDFPAFLLATQPFADLARRIGDASAPQQLPADVADELDWFVRAFADYLRTQDGEQVFDEAPRMTG